MPNLLDFQIYIPTFRRPNSQLTFEALQKTLYSDRITFVCDQTDGVALTKKYPEINLNFWIPPKEIQTIAQKRAFIIENTPFYKIVMMDDDLRFAVRKNPQDPSLTALVQAEPVVLQFYLDSLNNELDHYAHAGFSARQGNNRLTPDIQENTKMMYVLGYKPDVLRKNCELGRIETREDYDYCLQLLKRGFENRVFSTICVDQKYNAPGGASLERTIERSNADAEKLASLHPGLVKVVEKEYSSSTPRKEVIVYWKKAYAQRKK